MGLASNAGFLRIGTIEIDTSAAQYQLGKLSGLMTMINRSVLRVAGPTGSLSPKLAVCAAAHIRSAIANGGKNLPGYGAYDMSVDPRWDKVKESFGSRGRTHILTGSLMDSVKSLYVRTESGGRRTTVGIDQRKTVSKVTLMGKEQGRIRVAVYGAELQFGWTHDKPRPLIILAMADYLHKLAPNQTRSVMHGLAKGYDKWVSDKTKEAFIHKGRAMDKPSASGLKDSPAYLAGFKKITGANENMGVSISVGQSRNAYFDNQDDWITNQTLRETLVRGNPSISEMEITRVRRELDAMDLGGNLL